MWVMTPRPPQIIFSAMALAQLAFLGIVLFFQRSVVPPEGLDQALVLLVGIFVVLSASAASWYVGKYLSERASALLDPEERRRASLSFMIIRLAFAEGASFAALAIYLVTGEPVVLSLFAVSFSVFVAQRPRDSESA